MKLIDLMEAIEYKNVKNELEVKRADDKYIDLDMKHIGDVVINGKVRAEDVHFATSNARAAKRSDGMWEIRSVHVDEAARGKGIAEELFDEIIKHAKGPVTTSGVHSPDGKRKLDAMVRRGQAEKIGNEYIVKGRK